MFNFYMNKIIFLFLCSSNEHDDMKDIKKSIDDLHELVLNLTTLVTIGTPLKTSNKQGRRLNLYGSGDGKCFEKKADRKKLFLPMKKNMKPLKVLQTTTSNVGYRINNRSAIELAQLASAIGKKMFFILFFIKIYI